MIKTLNKVPSLWPGQTAVLAATGPSLTPYVVEIIAKYRHKFKLFGCNDAYRLLTDLDVFYACDGAWWDIHWNESLNTMCSSTYVWTQDEPAAKRFKLNLIKGDWKPGLSLDPGLLHYGHNSGYQQLNLAYLYGIRQFILVGYNMQKIANEAHFFGEHPKGLHKSSAFPMFVEAFYSIQPEIQDNIINCTTNSALTKFKSDDLEKVLYNCSIQKLSAIERFKKPFTTLNPIIFSTSFCR